MNIMHHHLLCCYHCHPPRACEAEYLCEPDYTLRCVYSCPIHGPVSIAIIEDDDLPDV